MSHHQHGQGGSRALGIALLLVVGFAGVEVAAGVAAGSLALLADAGHMLSDALSLGIALGAARLALRPATPQRSFGWRRAEILAAFANGAGLVALGAWILVEAGSRLSEPPEVSGGFVLVTGLAGLAVNVVAARVLHRSATDSLNVRAALRHVLADLVSSVGVVVAALVILTTGWKLADPLVGLLIGVLVLGSSWQVLRESAAVLLEGAPAGLRVVDVGHAMAAVSGVVEVHDLHVWAITSGFPALSAHVLVEGAADCHLIRLEVERLLRERYGLEHTTLQVEHRTSELLQLGER